MSIVLSASAIACKAVGLHAAEPDLEELRDGTACVTCGMPLATGDLVARWSPKDSFTDHPALANQNGCYVCQDCHVVLNNGDFSQRWLQTIFHETGCYQTASADMRAYALLNPPPPPFVWVLGDQKVQHIVWKAPVTLSHEAIFIRFGERTLRIRKTYLKQLFTLVVDGLQEWNRSLQAEWAKAKEANKKAAGKAPKEYKTPFLELDREYCSSLHASINPGFALHAKTENGKVAAAAITALENATPGEIWALSSLLFAKSPEPPRLVADSAGYRYTKQPKE